MNPKKYLIVLFIVLIAFGGVMMFRNQLFLPKRSITSDALTDKSLGWKFPVEIFPGGQVTDSDAYSEFRKYGTPRGLPVRLQIPSIGVDSAIEDAYITPDGRMDVPAGSENVAWFAIGTVPGQKGSAVIGGHYGIDDGVPKVFYDLNKLEVGDKVYIVDDFGNTLAFIVRSIRLFDREADATSVFYSTDNRAHLNIITCEGEWNKIDDNYPDRRVVFTDSVPSEGPVRIEPTSKIESIPSFPETAEIVSESQNEPSIFQKILSEILKSINNIKKAN